MTTKFIFNEPHEPDDSARCYSHSLSVEHFRYADLRFFRSLLEAGIISELLISFEK